MTLTNFFPYKVCINLDRRPERWERMQQRFAQHQIRSVRRFAALDGETLSIPSHWSTPVGSYGCLRSHLAVVQEARKNSRPSVLIFEDDVVFDTELNTKFSRYIKALPADWDMIFLGAFHMHEPVKTTEHIHKLTQANSTYAYALKHTVYDAFIDVNQRAETTVDGNNFQLQQQFNCYCFMPHLAWVEVDYSDAQERLTNHWYLQESLVLYGTEAHRLLQQTVLILAHQDRTKAQSRRQNLLFLVDCYQHALPGMRIVVVEQDCTPRVDPATLPENCQYLFLPDTGQFNKSRCFNKGRRKYRDKAEFIIFADGDTYLEPWDIRANVMMSQRYDCVSCFSLIRQLSADDTRQLRQRKITRGIDVTGYSPQQVPDLCSHCCLFTRQGLEAVDYWDETHPDTADMILSHQAHRTLQVFKSPNDALRLHPNA